MCSFNDFLNSRSYKSETIFGLDDEYEQWLKEQRKKKRSRGTNKLKCNRNDLPDVKLFFDGKLIYIQDRFGKVIGQYTAVSGKPYDNGYFDYSIDRQKMKDVGPIPEGSYYICLNKVQVITDMNEVISVFNEIIFVKDFGEWPGGRTAWGEMRVDIKGKSDYGRNGFTIHGGARYGSAGCIDLGPYVKSFFQDVCKVVKTNAFIPLTVVYYDK
jgi:hypothetical protein